MKILLQQAGVSQRKLAEACEVSPATISLIISAGRWPKTPDKAQLMGKMRAVLTGKVSEIELDRVFKVDSARCSAPNPSEATTKEEAMLLRKQGLYPATKRHFGMARDPFNDEVQSAEDVYLSADGRYMREAMLQVALHGGFMSGVSESGGGKSTLRRILIDQLNRESRPVIVIEPYVLAMEDNDKKGKTLKSAHIAEAIINSVSPLERPKQSQEARFRQLHRILRDSSRAGMSHLLIIEEAHSLPIPTLKHLKRFFELEDGFKKLLGIILLGQPELREKLAENRHEVREVVQRCEVIELSPMDSNLEDYLTFKFARAGKKVGEVIDKSGMDALRDKLTLSSSRRGRGENVSLLYPLAVGNLMTACMNQAAEIGVPLVTADVVKEV